MPQCLVACGGNAQRQPKLLEAAWARLADSPRIRDIQVSPWYRSVPSGGPAGQPMFVNGAALVDTSLAPGGLWERLQQIERDLGRQPAARWSARPVDLDLIFYEQLVLRTAQLTIPHPRWCVRQFVLQPACNLVPDWLDPVSGQSLLAVAQSWQTRPRRLALVGFSPATCSAWQRQLGPLLAQQQVDWHLVRPPLASDSGAQTPQVLFVPDPWYPLLPISLVPTELQAVPRVPLQFDPVDELRAAILASEPEACKMGAEAGS